MRFMRVITGSARGRRLETLEGEDVRPTTDRIKEAQNAGKKSKEKKAETVAETPAPVVATPVAPAQTDGVSDEVVAVISAAIATMYGSSEKARIKSIKKSSDGGRSAWAKAGVLDNTRPF